MLQVLNQGFQHFLDQGDPRVKDWPLMQTPFPGFAMIVAYIYFVKVAGPQFMEKREPYHLKTLMVVYNFVMVIVNFYIFAGVGRYAWFNGYSVICQPVDYSDDPNAVMLARYGYYYYVSKFVEFADTIFFVLRKKSNQVTTLHVVHHSIVPFSLWFGIKFAPGGHNSLFPFMNTFVHVLMYSYYGLAAMGEKYKKYLFWKKYMTYIQLLQFAVIMVHTVFLIVNKCDTTYIFISINCFHAVLFFGLFLNFFLQTYVKKTKSRAKLQTSEKPQTSLNKDEILTKRFTNGHSRHRHSYTQIELEKVRNSENMSDLSNGCYNQMNGIEENQEVKQKDT